MATKREPSGNMLPVADLRNTRITVDQRRVTRFVSTGTQAFVEVGVPQPQPGRR